MVKKVMVILFLVLAGSLAWAKPEMGADGRPLPPHLRNKQPQAQKQQPSQLKQQPGRPQMSGRTNGMDPKRPDLSKTSKARPGKAVIAQSKPGIKGLVKDDFLVNDDITGIGYYAGYQYDPKAALLPTGEMMVVWYDYRNSYDHQIFGRLVDPSGNPVGDDFLINDFTGSYAYSPAVAACGNSFVVTWYDYRNGNDYDIYAQLYTSTGSALGGNFLVNDDGGSSNQECPSLAANDSGFVVTWYDNRSGSSSDIYAQRYDPTGSPIGGNFLVNDDVSGYEQYYPSLAVNDSGFIITWDDYRTGSSWDIYAQRYNAAGDTLGGNFKVNDGGSNNTWCPSAAANDSGFMIAWYDYRSGNYDIYAQRFDTAGDTLGANFQVNDDGTSYDQYTWGASNVAANDSGFVITWYDYRSGNYYDTYAQRYDPAGSALGGNFIVNDTTSIYCYDPSVAANDSGFAVVWYDTRYNPSGYYDIICQRYGSTGSPLGGNFMANNDTGTADQWDASVAMDKNGNSVAVWYDMRNDDGTWNTEDIYGQLYDPAGNPVGGNFIINDTLAAVQRYGYDPRAAFLPGGGFVVTWGGYDLSWNGDIYAQLFDPSGAQVGGNIDVRDGSNSGYASDVAANDSGFVITWYDYRNGTYDVYAQCYDTAGSALGANFMVNDDAAGSNWHYSNKIAASGNGFVISWQDNRNGSYDIYAQLLKANGDTVGGNFLVNDGSNDQYDPSVAMADSGFVITWYDYRSGSNWDIYAQLYNANGDTVGGNFIVNDDGAGVNYHEYPSVSMSPDGHNMVIAWEDYRNDPNGDVAQIVAQKYVDGLPVDGNVVVNGSTVSNRYFWGAKRVACTDQRILFSWDDNRRMKGYDIYARLTDWDLQHIESELPVISYLDTLADDTAKAYGPYPVKAVVTDNQALMSVKLLYQVDGGTVDTLDMAFVSADTFLAEIPAQAPTPSDTVNVSYRVVARDSSLNTAVSGTLAFKAIVTDVTAPYIVSTSPVNGATGVGLNTPVVIAFSEPMDTTSIMGYAIPTDDYSLSWSAAGDTMTLTPGTPYSYSTTYSVIVTAGTDTSGNSLVNLPDTFITFTTISNQGPVIEMVIQPADTYDSTGPFTVRAVITDPSKSKSVISANLYYSQNDQAWTNVVGVLGIADTFNFTIPGSFQTGMVVSYYLLSLDNMGDSTTNPDNSPVGVYQFRILDALPPTTLTANGLDAAVELNWAPPTQILSYYDAQAFTENLPATGIASTRFTPMHYPCKLEQATSLWYNFSGVDSVIVHVYADDGTGMPDEGMELVTPFRIMPQMSPPVNVVDLSSYNIILNSGDFHVGYEIVTSGSPRVSCDFTAAVPIRSQRKLDDGHWYSFPYNWVHTAVVSYSNHTKGLALEKPTQSVNQQASTYPALSETLAKNMSGYNVFRGDFSGGPYTSVGTATGTVYTDSSVINNNNYYYVVRAEYLSPDTFSAWSNEASATPTGVEGQPGTISYSFYLMPASPNPVRSSAEFRFGLARSAQASLGIYNVLGQRVKTLVSGNLAAGNHTVKWNGCDDNGRKVSSGVYVYRLTAGENTSTRRFTVIR